VDGTCGRDGCSTCNGHGGHNLKQKLRDFDWEQLRSDHCWPTQYDYESRRRVNQPLHDQIVAGNETESTLYDFYFDTRPEHKGELNNAGKARLRYLVMKQPFAIAGIGVQTSFDPATDVERERHIRLFLATYSRRPVQWQITWVDKLPKGLFGEEGSASIIKMVGPTGGRAVPLPQYEKILKNTFYQGSGGGSQGSTGAAGGS
jgi:hypothetical protein